MGDWSLARQVSCASEIPPPFRLISPFLWCWPREARFIPHCTPEESAVMGAGPALPALAVSLPTGSSLLISPLLPSRGLLYQSPHRPRSQPSINVRKRSAARETGFDFSLELLPYFNIGFNRRLCLKEITIRSDSPAFKKYMPFLQSKLLEFALLLGVHLQSFFPRSLYVGRVVRCFDCTWCFEHDIDRNIRERFYYII